MGINCFFLVHLQFLRLITLDNLYSTLSRMGRLYQMGLLLFPLMDFFYIYIEKDIRALFPSDCNPFYAGFGNRDTDDFSYLKVGIPKGKIFIINSRGEVAVNCRVDTRLYSTLHALVNGMFPSMSSSDQEDISSWNYWKLLPTVSIYEGVSYNFCLISDGFGVANASSGIKLTWTLITHIFFPDRFCKAP